MTEEGKAEVEHWNPEVLENRVFMLIPVFFNDASNMDREASHRLKEFIERSAKKIPAEGFPKGLAEKFPQMSVAKSQQFWADLDGDATEDFHPFIQQIASIPKDGHSKDMCFAYPLQMAQEDLISQIKGGKPRRFQMKLGKAASKRCGKDAVSLQFRTPSLYGFSSGIAILVLEWHYLSNNQSPVRASEVIEGNFAISHPPRGKRKASASVESEVGEVSIEVDDFVVLTHAVLPPDLADRLSASRRILYTALRVAPNDDEGADNDLALLVHRLAHRQTFDYMPDPSRVSAGQLCPFANVRHAASIEGGCTLVQAGAEAPDALQGFINDRLRNTYLPLALVNFHAYFWLISQTQVLPASSVSANAHVEKEELECLQERVLNFRRVFYFPVASQISRHNEFHALWQQALQIDRRTGRIIGIERCRCGQGSR